MSIGGPVCRTCSWSDAFGHQCTGLCNMGTHLIGGEFQSDKYPTTPRGKVPLSVKDVTAQDLLWEYAQRRRMVDAEFSADLEAALRGVGYEPRVGSSEPISAGSRPPSSSDRDAVIEECAALVSDFRWVLPLFEDDEMNTATDDAACSVATQIEKAIRSLKSPPTVG